MNPAKSILIIFVFITLTSCVGSGTRETARPVPTESYYRVLTFDSMGMPSFSENLGRRPARKGADFFLVEEDVNGRALQYYHISIKGRRADMKKPFRTLLERTAGGVRGGALFALEILRTNPTSSSDEEAAAVLTFAALSVAVGTAGGITVGLVEGSYEAVVEAGRALSSEEELVSFSILGYDPGGRLTTIRAFEPGQKDGRSVEMFRIRYSYDGDNTTPASITVEDLPG